MTKDTPVYELGTGELIGHNVFVPLQTSTPAPSQDREKAILRLLLDGLQPHIVDELRKNGRAKFIIGRLVDLGIIQSPRARADLPVIAALEEYYIPQLKFSMEQNRKAAYEQTEKGYKEIAAGSHGAANAFEVSIGCIEEAISDNRARVKKEAASKSDGDA